MSNAEARTNIGFTQVGVGLLALATGVIHLYLFIVDGFLGAGSMVPIFQALFVGNFFAYTSLAAALILPIVPLAQARSLIRILLITIAVASIASYINVGVFTLLGNIAKAIEVLLVVVVALDAATSTADEDLAGRLADGAAGAAVQLVVGIVAGMAMFWFMISFLI
jgi:hypothetical protein